MLTPSNFDITSLLAVIGDAPYSMQQGAPMALCVGSNDLVPEMSQFAPNLKDI
jgi:hypothetical protein